MSEPFTTAVKDLKNLGEIYSIQSPSGKFYVGQAVQIRTNGRKHGYLERWKAHIYESTYANLKKGCTLLNKALRKYDPENMIVTLLEVCNVEELDAREQFYIEEFNSLAPNGYNLTTGGQFSKTLHESTREKIAEARRGTTASDETKEKMRKAHIGIKHSPETIEKLQILGKRPKKYNPRDLPKFIHNTTPSQNPGYFVRLPGKSIKYFYQNENRTLETSLEEAKQYLINNQN